MGDLTVIEQLLDLADAAEMIHTLPWPVIREIATTAHTALSALQAEVAKADQKVRGYQLECDAAGQAAGKALGYPWFKDDLANFPDATEANGVCIGEHTNSTIVEELAAKYLALQAENERLRGENADLKSSVVAFCGPWAVEYAKTWRLPEGHLDPTHYDILARCGARMDDFVRHERHASEDSPNG